jgi:DNA-binding NarL/FixJ family response regulator
MRYINVALFESTLMACELLSHAIESSCDEIKVITTGVSSEFQNHAELQKVDVAVISLALKDDPFGGLKLLRRLHRERPNLNCVLLLDQDNRDVCIEAFRSGAVAVCGRDKPCSDLCKCIRCVSEGQVWANSRQTKYMLEALVHGLPPLVTDAQGKILLSSREQEVASKVAEGMRNREIAELLRVSEHTVKNHLFRIFERLGISSRAELILYLQRPKNEFVNANKNDAEFRESGAVQDGSKNVQAPDRLRDKEALPSHPPGKRETTRRHEAHFYPDDASFVVGMAWFIESALQAGNAVIVVATEIHRKSLVQRLQAHGVDIEAAIEQGRYFPLDVAETLATFMVNDLPDRVRFLKVAGELIAAATKAATGPSPRVAACGEGTPTLWAQGKAQAAIQLEHLWDEIAKTCNVDIMCGYILERSQREAKTHIYERICAEHSAVRSL